MVLKLPQIYYFFSDTYYQDSYNTEEISLDDNHENITVGEYFSLLRSSERTQIQVNKNTQEDWSVDELRQSLSNLQSNMEKLNFESGAKFWSQLLENLDSFSVESKQLFSISGVVNNKPVSVMLHSINGYLKNEGYASFVINYETKMLYAFSVQMPFDNEESEKYVEIPDDVAAFSKEIQLGLEKYWDVPQEDIDIYVSLVEVSVNMDLSPVYYY